MHSFRKVFYPLLIAVLVLGVGICQTPAQEDNDIQDIDIQTAVPEQLVILDGPTDGPKMKVLDYWLSDIQFGRDFDRVMDVRPGEKIYGCYRNYFVGTATVNRVYKIEKYGLFKKSSGVKNTGNHFYSWGFTIPNHRAKNGQHPNFFFKCKTIGGNTVIRNMTFCVKRDAVCNSNRAFMESMTPELKTKIMECVNWVRYYLESCWLKSNAHRIKYSENEYVFMRDMNIWRPHVVLIHSHGSSADGGRIYLVDESYINASSLPTYGFEAPAGLFYAAVCSGAALDTLGNAFLDAGYDAFIGYTTSVYTKRNARFYKYFFGKATVFNRSVATALNKAIVWASGKGWTDVATARIIGDGSNLYLGGRSADGPADEEETPAEVEAINTVVAPWRDITTIVLTEAETNAVEIADQTERVQDLRDAYDEDLVTGIEEFTNVYRVSYKSGEIFLYGVDVDKETGKLVYQGILD